MTKRSLVAFFVTPIVLLAISVAACSDDDSNADDVSTAVGQVGGAETEFCSDLSDLNAAVISLRSLSASSTVDQAEEATKDVEDATENLKKSAGDVHEARVDALETAQKSLQSSVDDLDGDQTLSSALTSLAAPVTQIVNAQASLEANSGCP